MYWTLNLSPIFLDMYSVLIGKAYFFISIFIMSLLRNLLFLRDVNIFTLPLICELLGQLPIWNWLQISPQLPSPHLFHLPEPANIVLTSSLQLVKVTVLTGGFNFPLYFHKFLLGGDIEVCLRLVPLLLSLFYLY